jgi:hypothetical protein
MTDAVFKPAVEYPLRAFLDLSTAHLRPETLAHLNTLENDELPFSGGATQHGWLVYAPHEADLKAYPKCPVEIVEAMKKARELGADYVLYDNEADPDPNVLPVFDH